MFLGIFLEQPSMFLGSILLLLMATSAGQLLIRLQKFQVELISIIVLVSVQLASSSQFNALILSLYLIGLINGLLLPNPFDIRPRSWLLLLFMLAILWIFVQSDFSLQIGLADRDSAFGVNTADYKLDPRSLTYSLFIALVYFAPHFRGLFLSAIHSILLIGLASWGSNKFGMLFGAFCRFPPRIILPFLLCLFLLLGSIGFSNIDFSSARAALWSDFYYNFPACQESHPICTALISLNNDEGVRSFHSIVLDFFWYGGLFGLLVGIYLLLRVARQKSIFGASTPVLFSAALLFGFPPFFNERHALILYAVLILFQSECPRFVTGRAP
jgi:hypothetical protein